jgi:ABC-type polysaccharide/polyol phosphate export permease
MPSAVPQPARVVRARPRVGERVARIWSYRELLVGMTRKELKVRYKNSVLGFAWSLVNPLLYLVVFYVAFQVILRSATPAFPLFLLSGLLIWNLFSTGLGGATGSIVGNSGLVNKVSFPREILPLAAVGAALVHFFLQGLVLVAALAVVRWDVAWAYIPLLPFALIGILLLAGALGILLSALNVYLRDTAHFLELALLAWFWMTPIVYPFMTLGARGGWQTKIFMCNPVTPVVLVFQRALYAKLTTDAGTKLLPDWSWGAYAGYLGVTFGVGIIVLAIGVAVFGRLEANFAEEL